MLTLIFCAELFYNIFIKAETLENARLKPEYFTRNRKMPF